MFRVSVIRALRQSSPRVVCSPARALATTALRNAGQPPVKRERTPAEQRQKEALQERDRLQQDWDAPVVSYEQVLPKSQNPTADTFLIDVREPDEVAQGSIPSSVNIPLSVLSESLQLNPQAFEAKFGFQKPGQDQEVTFYCRSGKRSSSASDIAKRNGYKNILNYKGSWMDWTERQKSTAA